MAQDVPSSGGDVLLYFLAIFLPPVAVLLKRGCGGDFIINILLTILGWIPGKRKRKSTNAFSGKQWVSDVRGLGCIHAWWVISKHETPAV